MDEIYFGTFSSDYEAAYAVLTEVVGMAPDQASYVLDYLDCTDKVLEGYVRHGNKLYYYES